MSAPLLLALDAGTTGNRALVFDSDLRVVASAYREFRQSFPRPGWVEHDASEIWESCKSVLREAVAGVDVEAIAAIGIANQRETVVVWDRKTGAPAGPAIVWQDRRTAADCDRLRLQGCEPEIREKTGLRLDPYFSATKLSWIRQNGSHGADHVAGTIDSWLLWNLTGGRLHATDASNASRTLLYNLETGSWDPELCRIFGVPPQWLPAVLPTDADFGPSEPGLLGRPVPIRAIVGDQQGALFGQACFEPGASKATYGTGLFLMSQAGTRRPRARDLLSTVAWSIAGATHYALEGSAFIAGAAIAWLRDGLGILGSAGESEALARSIPGNGGVYFVPALSGLGAPHWDASARGLFIGLTRGTGRAELARAVLESIAYETREILDLFRTDLGVDVATLKTDGGATRNDFLMQFQADLLGIPVVRAPMAELTALGAAGIAGISVGVFSSPEDFSSRRPPGETFPAAAWPCPPRSGLSALARGGRALQKLGPGAVLKRFFVRLNVVLACGALAVWVFYLTLPDVSRLRTTTPQTTAFIEQRRAKLRAQGKNDRIERIVVPLGAISPSLRRAAVLTEDENFYLHSGIDWAATKLAIETDLGQGRIRVGGSTITQQLAKNLYLSPSRSPWRKLREIAIAAKMERNLPKNRILELYLNSIEWGERTYGVESASRRYFGHPASQLSMRESATLAAMIASPRLFDPARHPRRLARRTARILLLLERVQIPGV